VEPEPPSSWEEPNNGISDTGMVVSRSVSPLDQQMHGIAWTSGTGMVDLKTLAATGDPDYANYVASMATGTNKLGTLIVGQCWDGVNGWGGLPVVWTPSSAWDNGRSITKWTIHKLPTQTLSD